MTWLMTVAGVLALVVGVLRSRYTGVPPRVWWEQERMYRRPGAIVGRLGRVLLAVALLIGAFVALLALATVIVAAATVAALLAAGWWRLRRAAAATAPRQVPVERLDITLSEAPTPASSPVPPGRPAPAPRRPHQITEV